MSKSCSELSNQISESVAFNISSKQEYRNKKVHYLTKNLKFIKSNAETLDEFSVILRFFCRFMQRRKKAQKLEDPPQF